MKLHGDVVMKLRSKVIVLYEFFITQTSRRFCEMMAFLSSQRNIIDVLESTRIFNAIEIMCLRLRSGTEMRIENVPSTGSGSV